MKRTVGLFVGLALLIILLSGCGGSGGSEGIATEGLSGGTGSTELPPGTVTVSVADNASAPPPDISTGSDTPTGSSDPSTGSDTPTGSSNPPTGSDAPTDSTDPPPGLPTGSQKVLITISEISVHRTGGGWISLPLGQSPYTVDLLSFSTGNKAELVPPVKLETGKYTQIRVTLAQATLTIDGVDYPLEIPSDSLKLVHNFTFEVTEVGAVDLTLNLDLSQSIISTGSGIYKLKPVLRIVHTNEAAAIEGSLNLATFADLNEAIVIVTLDKDGSGSLSAGDEEYTRIAVEKGAQPTPFQIFWLAPEKSYIVQVMVGDVQVFLEGTGNLAAGQKFGLNSGNPI